MVGSTNNMDIEEQMEEMSLPGDEDEGFDLDYDGNVAIRDVERVDLCVE